MVKVIMTMIKNNMVMITIMVMTKMVMMMMVMMTNLLERALAQCYRGTFSAPSVEHLLSAILVLFQHHSNESSEDADDKNNDFESDVDQDDGDDGKPPRKALTQC